MTLDEILSDLYLRLHTADEARDLIGGRSTRTFPPKAALASWSWATAIVQARREPVMMAMSIQRDARMAASWHSPHSASRDSR